MRLRLTIILFFFAGGVIGGIAYARVGISILMMASGLLLLGLVYDSIKFRLILLHRKIKRE